MFSAKSKSTDKLNLINEMVKNLCEHMTPEKMQQIKQVSIDWKTLDHEQTLLPVLNIKFD